MRRYLCIALAVLAVGLSLSEAFAASPYLNKPAATCTTDPQFSLDLPPAGTGFLTSLITDVRAYLDAALGVLYGNVMGGIANDILLACLVYMIMYAIFFTTGMVRVTLYDFTLRMVKIGVVAMMASPAGWNFIGWNLVIFFHNGTDQIINASTLMLFNATGIWGGDTAFSIMDWLIVLLTSGRLFVAYMAMTFTGPYGPIFALITGMAIFSLVKAAVTAIWVYLMALVLRTLLLGMTPIFITFLLFRRTRHLFDGWLNQLINTCLQPIFLFVFFTFFATMMIFAIQAITSLPVCWTEAKETVRGTPFYMHYWRFEVLGGSGWEPYGGSWDWGGPTDASGPPFPIAILNILILFLLGDLANRFNSVALMVASDLASASTQLSHFQSGFSDWFSPVRGRGIDGVGGRAAGGLLRLGGRAGGSRGGAPPGDRAASTIAELDKNHVDNVRRRIAGLSNTRGGSNDIV